MKIDAWLTPNGELIEVGECMHGDYAENILKKEFGKNYYNNVYKIDKTPTAILCERGWVRIKYNNGYLPRVCIIGNCIDLTKPMRNTIEPAMNEKQLEVAKRLCDEVNTTLHVAINDKRFW